MQAFAFSKERRRESLEPDPLVQRIAKRFKNDAGMHSSQPCNAKVILILDYMAIACMLLRSGVRTFEGRNLVDGVCV